MPVGEGAQESAEKGCLPPSWGPHQRGDFLFLSWPWCHRAWNAALALTRRPGRAGCSMDLGGRGAGTLNLTFAQSWPWEVTGGSLVSWRGQKGGALLRVLACSMWEPWSVRARMLRQGVSGEGPWGHLRDSAYYPCTDG